MVVNNGLSLLAVNIAFPHRLRSMSDNSRTFDRIGAVWHLRARADVHPRKKSDWQTTPCDVLGSDGLRGSA
jgi:hypothetical protein